MYLMISSASCRYHRQDAELIIKYIKDYDPFDWKLKTESSITYFSKDEQWEEGIGELTSMPTQVAVLKTKGKEPRFFRTYDIEMTWRLEQNQAALREANNEAGNTLSLKKLDEA